MNTILNKPWVRALLFFGLCVSGTALLTYAYIVIQPCYNHYFGKFDYSFPNEGEPFVVKVEPEGTAPLCFQRIIAAAFPERKIEFTDSKKPHLIIRRRDSRYIKSTLNRSDFDKPSPYIIFSGEPTSLKLSEYRRNGLPLIDFVSSLPTNSRQINLPFLVWGGSIVRDRIYKNQKRLKQIAYIASNCVKERDYLFNLLKNKTLDGVDALGMCSNPNAVRAGTKDFIGRNGRTPGNWRDLTEIYTQYTFGFAMENSQVPGYITEKIMSVFKAGAIPIYWGDTQTVESYFNPKAFVNVDKFESLEAAADYIFELSKDPEKIKAMQEEPIFKDNVMPDMLKIDLADETQINPIIENMAQVLRTRYFELLNRNF